MFFAYTTLKDGDSYTGKNVLGTNDGESTPTLGFNSDNPYINNFKPSKTTIVAAKEGESVWADGEKQKDLLIAFTEQSRSTSAVNVPIEFNHALTQVSILATSNGNNDNRIVKIKGAWIVNATDAGNLVTTLERSGENDKIVKITNKWAVPENAKKTTFGSFYTTILQLDNSNKDLLFDNSLMLIPENLTAWNKKGGNDNNNGAYIMLLCRVELEHDGVRHEGDTSNPNLDDIAIEGGKHYHQLFPVNETEFNGAQYGFVCVPLSSNWNPNGIGKHYTYKLNICGNGTGAGQYPPMAEDDMKKLVPTGTEVAVVGKTEPQPLEVVTAIPSKKHVGDNVLDDPIQFTVTVKDWDEPDENWTQGTGNF